MRGARWSIKKQQTESSQADGKTMDRRFGACRFRNCGSGDGAQRDERSRPGEDERHDSDAGYGGGTCADAAFGDRLSDTEIEAVLTYIK